MNRERLELALKEYESCNLQRHEVDGKDHIGYGILLEDTILPDEILEYLGVEDEDDIQEITQEQAEWLFDFFVDVAHQDALVIYTGDVFNALTPIRQEVLVNLSYNLGINKLRAFRRMNKAVLVGDWNGVSLEMLDSKAAKQTPGTKIRYERLAAAFTEDDEKHLELPTLFDSPADLAESEPTEDVSDEGLKSADTVDLLKGIQASLNELLRRAGG